MGYVHSPHDHPEVTDRELAAAIREALAAQGRIKAMRNGGIDMDGLEWMAVADHELNTAIMHLFLIRIDGVKHQIAQAEAWGDPVKIRYWKSQQTAMETGETGEIIMGMSDEIDAVFTVSCFACGDIASSHSITPNIESKPKFINHLRSQGWHYTQRHGWQCKPCQGPRTTSA